MIANDFICANSDACQKLICGAPIEAVSESRPTPCSLRFAASLCRLNPATLAEIAKFGEMPIYAKNAGIKPPKILNYFPLTFDLNEIEEWAKRLRYARNDRKYGYSGENGTLARRERVVTEGLVTRADMCKVLGLTYAALNNWIKEFPGALKEEFKAVPSPELSISSKHYYKPEVLDWCKKVRAYLDEHSLRNCKRPSRDPCSMRPSEFAVLIGTTYQGFNRWKRRGIPQCYKKFGCPDLPDPLPGEKNGKDRYDTEEVAKFVPLFKRAQAAYIASVREGKE